MPKPEPQEITITGQDGKSFTIDMSSQPKITNQDHVHDYKEDPTDKTENYVAMVCKCGFGYLKKLN